MKNTIGKHEIPKGLEAYEFVRDLKQSEQCSCLLEFLPRTNLETGKPVLTEDLKPDHREIDWSEIFGRPTDYVEIEIGSGKGGFMVDYGKKYPERCLLGSEWDATWAYYAAERLQKHQLNSLRMLRADVFYFLRDRVPANSVDAFHMYFPDPWPKKRQQKNRLLRPEFLSEVARVLKPGARPFYWGTDHAEYNEVALEIFANTPGAHIMQKNSAEPTEGIMTNFEKKYRLEGRPIYRSVIEFRK